MILSPEVGRRISTISGEPLEKNYPFQLLSVCTQQFDTVAFSGGSRHPTRGYNSRYLTFIYKLEGGQSLLPTLIIIIITLTLTLSFRGTFEPPSLDEFWPIQNISFYSQTIFKQSLKVTDIIGCRSSLWFVFSSLVVKRAKILAWIPHKKHRLRHGRANSPINSSHPPMPSIHSFIHLFRPFL